MKRTSATDTLKIEAKLRKDFGGMNLDDTESELKEAAAYPMPLSS